VHREQEIAFAFLATRICTRTLSSAVYPIHRHLHRSSWCAHPDIEELASERDTGKETGIVLCCKMGGTLEPRGSIGVQSRSLIAAYELVQAGFGMIRVLNDGVNGWQRDGRDLYILDE
jgi:hypothetical protein